MNGIELIWPEVFITGKLETNDKMLALAHGLCGWGNCIMAEGKIPENFGKGMAEIGLLLGISAIPESLMAESRKYLGQNHQEAQT